MVPSSLVVLALACLSAIAAPIAILPSAVSEPIADAPSSPPSEALAIDLEERDNDSLSALFPLGQSSDSWSTHSGADNSVSLSTTSLKAFNIMSLSHDVTPAPDGTHGIHAHFKKGAYDFKGPDGGLSMFASGPDSVDLTTAKEATFGYRVFFQDGFKFNKGGKMPGFYGGEDPSVAIKCSGGRKLAGCWSTRMMFRTEAAGELYAYLPPGDAVNHSVCKIKGSHCNPSYGDSVGRGAFHWKTGEWTTVSQRVRLNDVGKANGEVEIFADGVSVIKATGLKLRHSSKGRIRGFMLQTFFGGHDPTWASPKDQSLWFSDLSVSITQHL